jgi:hypothetical protein
MQTTIRYEQALPLAGNSGFSRRISIDSSKIDKEHIQIRGELADNRADYQQDDKEIAVHGMVVRLTFNVNSRVITKSEMALPQMAFKGICVEQMPAKAEELEGTMTGKGFNQKVAEVFGTTRGCMHLMTLYRAIGVAMNQITSWNHSFRQLDSDLPVESVEAAMAVIHGSVMNSCHVWQEGSGGVTLDFAKGEYGPMLERCTPKLLGRWKQHREESNEENNKESEVAGKD